VAGKWYVVFVVSEGGFMVSRTGQRCTVRATCNWCMANTWGPQFEKGFLDVLFGQAAAM
jgi:hypothetical protein